MVATRGMRKRKREASLSSDNSNSSNSDNEEWNKNKTKLKKKSQNDSSYKYESDDENTPPRKQQKKSTVIESPLSLSSSSSGYEPFSPHNNNNYNNNDYDYNQHESDHSSFTNDNTNDNNEDENDKDYNVSLSELQEEQEKDVAEDENMELEENDVTDIKKQLEFETDEELSSQDQDQKQQQQQRKQKKNKKKNKIKDKKQRKQSQIKLEEENQSEDENEIVNHLNESQKEQFQHLSSELDQVEINIIHYMKQMKELKEQRRKIVMKQYQVTQNPSTLSRLSKPLTQECQNVSDIRSHDILYSIFSFLPLFPDILNIMCVSKRWRKVILFQRNAMWKSLEPYTWSASMPSSSSLSPTASSSASPSPSTSSSAQGMNSPAFQVHQRRRGIFSPGRFRNAHLQQQGQYCVDFKDQHLLQIASLFPDIETVRLTFCTNLTDAAIRRVMTSEAGFRDVKDLDLRYTKTYAVTIKQLLKKHLNLRRVRISSTTDCTVEMLTQYCNQITELELDYSDKITDASLFTISKNLQHLESLTLDQCVKVTNEGIDTLCHSEAAQKLSSLSFKYCSSLIDAFNLVCQLPQLEHLCLKKCSGIDFYLPESKTMEPHKKTLFPNLKYLDVSQCYMMGDEEIERIFDVCPVLEELDISRTRITELTLKSETLRRIRINKVTSMTSILIEECPRLEEVIIGEASNLSSVTVNGADGSLNQLRYLTVQRAKKLIQPNIVAPSLRMLDLSHCNKMLSMRNSCEELRTLILDGCKVLHPDAVSLVVQNHPQLRTLSILLCDRITAQDIAELNSIRETMMETSQQERETSISTTMLDSQVSIDHEDSQTDNMGNANQGEESILNIESFRISPLRIRHHRTNV